MTTLPRVGVLIGLRPPGSSLLLAPNASVARKYGSFQPQRRILFVMSQSNVCYIDFIFFIATQSQMDSPHRVFDFCFSVDVSKDVVVSFSSSSLLVTVPNDDYDSYLQQYVCVRWCHHLCLVLSCRRLDCVDLGAQRTSDCICTGSLLQ